jgi:hypothetical protein
MTLTVQRGAFTTWPFTSSVRERKEKLETDMGQHSAAKMAAKDWGWDVVDLMGGWSQIKNYHHTPLHYYRLPKLFSLVLSTLFLCYLRGFFRIFCCFVSEICFRRAEAAELLFRF